MSEKNLHNEDGTMRFIDRMKAQDYIAATQEYLDYIEDHIANVQRAFVEVSDACDGMAWVGDDATWHAVRQEVENHDLSKLSAQEFTQYRDKFYPVQGANPVGVEEAFEAAWEHHKVNNPHHHETAVTDIDIIHMVIDWTAMGYRFGDTAQEFYERTKTKISLPSEQLALMHEIFDNIAKHSLRCKETIPKNAAERK